MTQEEEHTCGCCSPALFCPILLVPQGPLKGSAAGVTWVAKTTVSDLTRTLPNSRRY